MERVTGLAIHRLRTRPESWLGIIAFIQSQQGAIENSIYERRRKYPEIDVLFHVSLAEPLFVRIWRMSRAMKATHYPFDGIRL